jgi:hypothetical protein
MLASEHADQGLASTAVQQLFSRAWFPIVLGIPAGASVFAVANPRLDTRARHRLIVAANLLGYGALVFWLGA